MEIIFYKDVNMSNLSKYAKKPPRKRIDCLSIIITAYNSQEFIEAALDSLYKNTWIIANNNYEILLGIDGCELTLNQVNKIKHKYKNLEIYYFNENVGTYILSNTLVTLSRFEYVLRFDSDDIALPNMIEVLINNVYDKKNNKFDMVRFKFVNFLNNNMSERRSVKYLSCGCILFRRDMFLKFGGYMPWRCGADSEFIERVKDVIKINRLHNEVMLRRKHGNSLTECPLTGNGSPERKRIQSIVKDNYDNKITTIELTTSLNYNKI